MLSTYYFLESHIIMITTYQSQICRSPIANYLCNLYLQIIACELNVFVTIHVCNFTDSRRFTSGAPVDANSSAVSPHVDPLKVHQHCQHLTLQSLNKVRSILNERYKELYSPFIFRKNVQVTITLEPVKLYILDLPPTQIEPKQY